MGGNEPWRMAGIDCDREVRGGGGAAGMERVEGEGPWRNEGMPPIAGAGCAAGAGTVVGGGADGAAPLRLVP